MSKQKCSKTVFEISNLTLGFAGGPGLETGEVPASTAFLTKKCLDFGISQSPKSVLDFSLLPHQVFLMGLFMLFY